MKITYHLAGKFTTIPENYSSAPLRVNNCRLESAAEEPALLCGCGWWVVRAALCGENINWHTAKHYALRGTAVRGAIGCDFSLPGRSVNYDTYQEPDVLHILTLCERCPS